MKEVVRYTFIAWSILWFTNLVKGQEGFTKSYQITRQTKLSKVLYSNDDNKLLLYGAGVIDSINRTRVFIAEVDTFGHVERITFIPDSNSVHNNLVNHSQFILTLDTGYLAIIDVIGVSTMKAVKLDSDLNIEWQVLIPKPGVQTLVRRVKEINNMFFIHGYSVDSSIDRDFFIVALDQNGVETRSWLLGSQIKDELVYGTFKRDQTIYFNGTEFNELFGEPADQEIRNVIYQLDDKKTWNKIWSSSVNPSYGLIWQVIPNSNGFFMSNYSD